MLAWHGRRDPADLRELAAKWWVISEVVFDLVEAREWRFLGGEPSPEVATWTKGQANPVREIDAATANELTARRPEQSDAGHGWSLEVAPDGHSATVRASRGPLTLTAMQETAARLELPATRVPSPPTRARTADQSSSLVFGTCYRDLRTGGRRDRDPLRIGALLRGAHPGAKKGETSSPEAPYEGAARPGYNETSSRPVGS